MNTIKTKGLYKAAQSFVEKGEEISNNNLNNKIFKLYYNHLIELDNKSNTIILKLMYIVFLEINDPSLFEISSQIISIKNKKAPNKMISYFTEEEIKIIINYLNKSKDLKRLTMICVLYETGARVSEFINIKLSDLNLSDNANITLYGKGNKTRIVPISQELVRLINK